MAHNPARALRPRLFFDFHVLRPCDRVELAYSHQNLADCGLLFRQFYMCGLSVKPIRETTVTARLPLLARWAFIREYVYACAD